MGTAIAQGQLVPILESYTPLGVPIAVVYAQKQYLSAKVKANTRVYHQVDGEFKARSNCRVRRGSRVLPLILSESNIVKPDKIIAEST